MSKSEFDDDFLRLVEEFNTSPGAVERRSKILRALNLQPGDHVLEVYPPDVYFLLGLRSASRYAQFLPTDYTRPEFVNAAVDDLNQTRPRYILWNNSYIKPEDRRDPGDHLGKLADLVTREYMPSGPTYELGGQPMQIWERRSDQDIVR